MRDFSVVDDDVARRQRTFTDLYSDHHSWLHGWLRKKLGCSQRAADLAHDAFIRVLTLAEPHTIKEPRAFLATMAGRLLIDGARRRRIEQAYLEALAIQAHDAGMPDPEAIHVALEALEKIAVMLAGLPDKNREAFLLSRLDGLTYSEIAIELKVSASTVKNYVAGALVHCYNTLYGAEQPS
ncbi:MULTISPECIES: sigma-70 family RNA polymerase sigma factor [unclassified Pseudomonas]|uniref:sigma-70 family RNA polymerase sigma factor n=1 Tax=unclassified Pseudomonas TaxID=196821 RepID=UPI000270C3F5|nr:MULTISPECIES: sigma-70 family RNA polymerase sigma factor [unclassified Pseudomonas]EJM87710.1 RNA polymerase sigma factor, sigma-70 family [Pseudomonas sp. GM67]MBD9550142.1 sigma-70 family RNA polymerase sigma factor [Pseudomonas sp. PDM01]